MPNSNNGLIPSKPGYNPGEGLISSYQQKLPTSPQAREYCPSCGKRVDIAPAMQSGVPEEGSLYDNDGHCLGKSCLKAHGPYLGSAALRPKSYGMAGNQGSRTGSGPLGNAYLNLGDYY